MTLSPFVVYLIGQADNLAIACVVFCLASAAAMFALFMVADLEYDKAKVAAYAKSRKLAFRFFLGSLVVGTLAPSSKTIAAMIVLPAIANNEDAKAIAGNGIEALRLLSEQYVKDLAGKEDEKK